MQIKRLATPPVPTSPTSWRTLYLNRRFEQRRLVGLSELRREVDARGLFIGPGSDKWQEWDRLGALRPVAFGLGAWSHDVLLDPDGEDTIRFREEAPFERWDTYSYEVWGHPETTPLYSPWQLLPLHDVLDGETVDIALSDVLDADRRENYVRSLNPLLVSQQAAWLVLDDGWAATLKFLTALQNRYWPTVSGRVTLPFDFELGERVDPMADEVRHFDPMQVLGAHGISEEQVASLYEWLCTRGARLESSRGSFRDLGGDRWAGLRMLADRRVRRRMRGPARSAMDFYEAAEMIGRLWHDMTGRFLPGIDEAPHRRTIVPIDHESRAESPHVRSPKALRRQLSERGVWPGRIHVVVEGDTEQRWVEALVSEGLGWVPDDLLITNLGGVGAAKRVEALLEIVADYATASALILDAEGDVTRHVEQMIRAGLVDPHDLLIVDTSFEERNFSDAELAAAARYIARNPPGERPPVQLRLGGKELRAEHKRRVVDARRGEEPGLAETLLSMTRDPARGPVNLTKLELNKRLLQVVLEDLRRGKGEEVETRRPIVKFVFRRIANSLLNEAWR